jgi:hypothetical protein
VAGPAARLVEVVVVGDPNELSGVAHANPAMSRVASTAVLMIEMRLIMIDLPCGLLVDTIVLHGRL